MTRLYKFTLIALDYYIYNLQFSPHGQFRNILSINRVLLHLSWKFIEQNQISHLHCTIFHRITCSCLADTYWIAVHNTDPPEFNRILFQQLVAMHAGSTFVETMFGYTSLRRFILATILAAIICND